MILLQADSKKYFGESGKLSDLIEGYQLRNEQLEMSEAIMEAVADAYGEGIHL